MTVPPRHLANRMRCPKCPVKRLVGCRAIPDLEEITITEISEKVSVKITDRRPTYMDLLVEPAGCNPTSRGTSRS